MAARDGSGPPQPSQDPIAPTPPDDLHKALFQEDEWVICRLCDMRVPNIQGHLPVMHPRQTIEQYIKAYPQDKVYAKPTEPAKPPPPRVTVKVTEQEAAAHPGGRDAAFIEKTLQGPEASLYRDYVRDLLKQGLPKGFELATIALDKIQATRLILLIAQVHNESDGRVIATEHQQNLAKIRTKIDEGIQSLKESMEAEKKDIDPLRLWERDQAEAEAYVRTHIGEHTSRCPNPTCGQMLTAPELPHWAFAPMMTAHGVEWPVWSPELWDLVREGVIPIWVMAFALRTSPEGLRYTCRRRGEEWPEELDATFPDQEVILRRRLNVADENFQPEHLKELIAQEFQDVKDA